jgi:hypothetical protein
MTLFVVDAEARTLARHGGDGVTRSWQMGMPRVRAVSGLFHVAHLAHVALDVSL